MPDRRSLRDADGAPVATYIPVHRGGRNVADLLELEVPVEQALPTILSELRGWRVAGPVELGRALVAAGGTPARHAHVYVHDLQVRPEPAPPEGIELAPVDRPAAELLPAYLAAHSPEHVDWPVIAGEDSEGHLRRILAGEYGRLLESSGVALAGEEVVGGILVAELDDPEPPFQGAWVMELFRTPGYRGAGRALLERALVLGDRGLGLAVTDGNPAERLYQQLGFRRVLSAFSVDL